MSLFATWRLFGSKGFTNLKPIYSCLVEHNDYGVPLGFMEIIVFPRKSCKFPYEQDLQELLAHYPDMFTRKQLKARFDDLWCRRTWVADA